METCDRCGNTIKDIDGELQDAKCLKFVDTDGTEYFVARCNACFERDKSLTNYKQTEVFTRTVGYYRPVQNFHKGKVAEYKDRLTFKMTEETPVVPETTEEVAPEATPAE